MHVNTTVLHMIMDKRMVVVFLLFIPIAYGGAVRTLPATLTPTTICEDSYYTISVADAGFGYDVVDNLAAGWAYRGLGGDAATDCAIQPGNTQVICSAVVQGAPRSLQLLVSNDPGTSSNVFNGLYYDEQANIIPLQIQGFDAASITVQPSICMGDADNDRYYTGAAPSNTCACLGGNDCNDADSATHPGGFDVPNDGRDQDCCNGDATNVITVSRSIPTTIGSTTAITLAVGANGNCNTVQVAERFDTSRFNCNTASHNGICDEARGYINWTVNPAAVSSLGYTLSLASSSFCYSFSGTYTYAGQSKDITGNVQQGTGCGCQFIGEEVCSNGVDENCDGNDATCAAGCTPTHGAVDICGNSIDENCDGSDAACVAGCAPRNGGMDLCGNSIDENCDGADSICRPGCTPSNRGVEICNNGRDENCDGRDDACHPLCSQAYIGSEICGNAIDEDCDGVIDRCISGNYPANALLPLGQVCSSFQDFAFCQGREICNADADENCDGLVESCLASSCAIRDAGLGLGCEACGNNVDEDCDGFSESCINCLLTATPELCGDEFDEDCDGVANACIPCDLTSVSVVPDCAGGSRFGCEPGETLSITAEYSGGCPQASIIQLDAIDITNGACLFTAAGTIQGAEIVCTGSPCTGTWTFPAIPPFCQNKRMDTWRAYLYRDAIVPGSELSTFLTPTGMFDIGAPCYDLDGDNYGQAGKNMNCATPQVDCCDTGTEGYAGCTLASRSSINPGAAETTANSGVDNDCNPATDADNDGYASPLDCNDNSPAVYPGSQDTIANPGVDNDCNPATDADNDGYRADNGDCKDTAGSSFGILHSLVYPNAPELCDGVDNNCDGAVDNGGSPAACGSGACAGTRQCVQKTTETGTGEWTLCSSNTLVCGQSSYGQWSACSAAGCYTGTQSRPRTDYACNSEGVCTSSSYAEAQSCPVCAPCSDECSPEATQCLLPSTTLQECRTDGDEDSCYEWVTTNTCASQCGGVIVVCPDPQQFCGNYPLCASSCPALQDECKVTGGMTDGLDNDCDSKYDTEENCCPGCSYANECDTGAGRSNTCGQSCDRQLVPGYIPLGSSESSVASGCTDRVDNNCNGESDYDSSDGRHGDASCPVGITSISVLNANPCPNTQIEVECGTSAPGVNSLTASISGSACAPSRWKDGTNMVYVFTCNSGAAGSKQVSCSVNTGRSYQAGSDKIATLTVKTEAECAPPPLPPASPCPIGPGPTGKPGGVSFGVCGGSATTYYCGAADGVCPAEYGANCGTNPGACDADCLP